MLRLKFFLGTMLLAVLAVGVSSFTVKDYNKRAFADVCFVFDTGGYTETSNIAFDCPNGTIKCGFCVDEAFLDQVGQPQAYVQRAFQAKWNTVADDGTVNVIANEFSLQPNSSLPGYDPHPAFSFIVHNKPQ